MACSYEGKGVLELVESCLVFLLWHIWNRRNDKVFNDNGVPRGIIVDRVRCLVDDFNTYTTRVYGVVCRPPSSPNIWNAPPPNMIKINYDTSLRTEGWVGMGVVSRDHNGDVIFAASRRVIMSSW